MYARTIAGFAFLTGMAWSVWTVAEEQGLQDHTRDTWRIALKLDTPELNIPAIQYAVFDRDPIPAFKASLIMLNSHHQKELEQATAEARQKLPRSAYMRVHWDLGFKITTGDKLYLVTPGQGQNLMSNSHDGKKWIVSKTSLVKGKPVCWCLPIELKTGEGIEVTFTEKNVFDLQAIYDDVMRASVTSQ